MKSSLLISFDFGSGFWITFIGCNHCVIWFQGVDEAFGFPAFY